LIVFVDTIDTGLHAAGVAALLSGGRRRLSLVDCTSFAVCRLLAIEQIFAFDQHFVEQGFHIVT
jgi:predicted nucleic acid-binding protein